MARLLLELITDLNSPFTQTAIRCVSEVSYLGSKEVGRAGHNKLSPSVTCHSPTSRIGHVTYCVPFSSFTRVYAPYSCGKFSDSWARLIV